jgi:hypothetical protein
MAGDKTEHKRLMIWIVKMGGHAFAVETRDNRDWVDDFSDATMRIGAIAEVPWREPITGTDKLPTREATSAMNKWNEDREVTHRRAIEMLAHHNHFTEVKDGVVVAVFEAVKIGEAD